MLNKIVKSVITLLIYIVAINGQYLQAFTIFDKSDYKISIKEQKEIIKGLWEFFMDVGDCQYEKGEGLYFRNAPKEFSKQLIKELQRKNCGSRFKVLKWQEITQNRKISYLGINFKSISRNEITIYINSYSSCYETAYYYFFKKKQKWRHQKALARISECGFGCKDGKCQRKSVLDIKNETPPPIVKKTIEPNL